MSVSAAPQPRACAPTYGDDALANICDGSEVFGPLNTFRFTVRDREDGEQQRRRLPRGPGDREQGTADDPADRRGQHDRHRYPGLAGPEGVARLTQRVRHQPQHLVRGADHDRQHQAAEGERAGQAGVAEVQHPDGEDEQPHHDRGHARHHVRHEPDDLRQHPVAAVLIEVDRPQHAERHRHDRGQGRDLERADDRRPMPPTFAGRTFGGIEPVRNCQLMIDAPLAITVYRTNPSGTIASTNAITIKAVMMRLLVRRQDGGSRRLTACVPVLAAITPPSAAGRNVPRPRGRRR